MIVQSKAIVLVVISFLLVVIVYSSIAQFYSVSAKPKITQTICAKLAPTAKGAAYTETCCQFIKGQVAVSCNSCQYDSNGNQVGNCSDWTARQTFGGNSTNPTSSGTLLPPSGNNTGGLTNGQTGLPGRLGNSLPPSNNTSALPPGSIFKVPPGTTNSQPTGNNTGTLPALTVTKEHNPASPNILSLTGNATNPSNNTGPVKLSPLTTTTTSGGHHHHKGGTSSTSNTNSTGH